MEDGTKGSRDAGDHSVSQSFGAITWIFEHFSY